MLEQMTRIREEAQQDRDRARKEKEQLLREVQAVATKVDQLSELKNKVDELEQENTQLRTELDHMKLQVDLQDQRMKSRNLIIYGLPGEAGEERLATETSITDACRKLGIHRTPELAHRLSQRKDSPVLVQFNSKQDAQEVFKQLRQNPGPTDNTKLEVRYHLSSHLYELLKSANLLKREAGWAYARPLTSNQTVEIVKNKEPNSRRVTVRNLQELVNLKNTLLNDGAISRSSPANEITAQRTLRKRPRNAKDTGTSKRIAK